MCKMNNGSVGIKKLDFSSFRGKMAAFLTDGRQIKNLSLKQRSEWMILDDQYFTFADLSKVYSVCELLKQTY